MSILRILMFIPFALAAALIASGCGSVAEEQREGEHLAAPVDMVLVPGGEEGDRIYILNGLQGSISVYNPENEKFVRGDTDDKDSPYFFEPFLYDLEATGDGRLLISTGDSGKIYLFDPSTEEREEIRLGTKPVRFSCSLTENMCALVPSSEQKLLLFNPSDSSWDEYQLDFQPVFVLYFNSTIFYFCPDKIYVALASQPDTFVSEIEVTGFPHVAIYSERDQTVYLATSDPLKLWIYSLSEETLDVVNLPEQVIPSAFAEADDELYLVGAEGSVYVYLKQDKRFCGSRATRPVFIDDGPFSNPVMSEVAVRDCLVNDEKWRVEYDQEERAYVVKGEKSGTQLTLAYEDQTYVSDAGSISFVIHSGEYHTTNEDRFEFRTYAGIGFIRVGLLPRAALSWYDAEEKKWLVFVANVLSDSISVIDTEEHKVIDTLE